MLKVSGLTVEIPVHGRGGASANSIRILDDVSFEVSKGQTLGLVGESGSGKSMTSLALMGLLPEQAKISASAQIEFAGQDILKLNEKDRRGIRGGRMAMIFQDPMTSLNPSYTIGVQIDEALKFHRRDRFPTAESRRQRSRELLNLVGISAADERLKAYPHQLSGGMSQRMMIAMALAGEPELLIADEPTTALDVTIQAQILWLLRDLQKRTGLTLLLITHDLGVVGSTSDHLAVMYAGQVVERGPTQSVLQKPQHPYTEALLKSYPGHGHAHASNDDVAREFSARVRLPSIPGAVPSLKARPTGCQFHPRCGRVFESCLTQMPSMDVRKSERSVRCFLEGLS